MQLLIERAKVSLNCLCVHKPACFIHLECLHVRVCSPASVCTTQLLHRYVDTSACC